MHFFRNSSMGLLALVLWTTHSRAQTYLGSAGPVRDDGVVTDFYCHVHSLNPPHISPSHGLKSVCINVAHSWMADLDIRLIAPDGASLLLASGLGSDGDGYFNTCFEMSAVEHISTQWWPFSGVFRSYANLGNANNGQQGNGQWILRILDTYAYADAGDVLNWQLTFGEEAASPDVFEATSLPIVIIQTDNSLTIPDDPKIRGTIRIIDNGPGQPNRLTDAAAVESYLGIEVRGSSSQMFPKKSYGFETWDKDGEDNAISLLGLPEEEDWILYAPYTDKSFLRDALTYYLGNATGHYAPRTVFCELFLNGDYHGVYCLEEKIKRDKNRVPVTKLEEDDIHGNAVTGGYLLKVDRDDGDGTYFVSAYKGSDINSEVRIVYEDPEGPDLAAEQKTYIQRFFADFENALYGPDFKDPERGYRSYLDMNSLVDFFLVNEIGLNVDGYRLSTFMHKDRNSKDSLLHFGPLWDFNLAYGNVDYCDCQYPQGWTYVKSTNCGNTPLWWPRFTEDEYFLREVHCRYDELRTGILSTESIFNYIDSMALLLSDASGRNYAKWPILGRYVWPNHFIGQTYEEEVAYLKDWISDRLSWLDEHLPGFCSVSAMPEPQAVTWRFFPNPADDAIRVEFQASAWMSGEVIIRDMRGVIVIVAPLHGPGQSVDISSLSPGMYLVELNRNGYRPATEKMVIIRHDRQ